MDKKKTIAIIGIIISVCLIGFSTYKIIETTNKVNQDSNGEVLNKNTKVKGDLKTNTEENNSTINNNELENKNDDANDLLKKYKEMIFKQNDELIANDIHNIGYSKLIDFDILKIEEVTVDGNIDRYIIDAKYKCDNNSWNCVYYSQVSDPNWQGDENGYYDNTFYHYIDERYGKGLMSQLPPISGGPSNTNPTHETTKKTIYEK